MIFIIDKESLTKKVEAVKAKAKAEGVEVIVLTCPKTNRIHCIIVVPPSY